MVRSTACPLSVHLSICHSIIFICLSVFSYLSSSFITAAYLPVNNFHMTVRPLLSLFLISFIGLFVFHIFYSCLGKSVFFIVCVCLFAPLSKSTYFSICLHIFYSFLSISFSLSLSFDFSITLCPSVTMFQVFQFLYFPLCFCLLCLLSTVKSENG
jgi:hypothetical protein